MFFYIQHQNTFQINLLFHFLVKYLIAGNKNSRNPIIKGINGLINSSTSPETIINANMFNDIDAKINTV